MLSALFFLLHLTVMIQINRFLASVPNNSWQIAGVFGTFLGPLVALEIWRYTEKIKRKNSLKRAYKGLHAVVLKSLYIISDGYLGMIPAVNSGVLDNLKCDDIIDDDYYTIIENSVRTISYNKMKGKCLILLNDDMYQNIIMSNDILDIVSSELYNVILDVYGGVKEVNSIIQFYNKIYYDMIVASLAEECIESKLEGLYAELFKKMFFLYHMMGKLERYVCRKQNNK